MIVSFNGLDMGLEVCLLEVYVFAWLSGLWLVAEPC